jgi:hypothetical protein
MLIVIRKTRAGERRRRGGEIRPSSGAAAFSGLAGTFVAAPTQCNNPDYNANCSTTIPE